MHNARKPGRPRRHADSVSAAVVDDYMAGRTITEICKQHNIARSTVYLLLNRHGVTPERRNVAVSDELSETVYDITVEQELIVDHLTSEITRLRSVLDRGD